MEVGDKNTWFTECLREPKKEVLTLPTTLNTNWGLNGYHRKC